MLTAQAGAPDDGAAPLDAKELSTPLRKSAEELDKLLPAGWQKRCGLVMATGQDGTTEWVLEADKAAYEEHGAALLHD